MTGSYQLHILATLPPEKGRGTVPDRNGRHKKIPTFLEMKAIPVQGWTVLGGFRRLLLPYFETIGT